MIDVRAADDVVPYFQPVFSLDPLSVTGCEVFARRFDQDGNELSQPSAFAAGCITAGLVGMATDILRPILQCNHDFTISFSMPMTQLLSDGLMEWFAALCETHELAMHRVILEITEDQLPPNLEAAESIADKLRGAGASISIGEVGSGRNTLIAIQRLGATRMKIDREFIEDVCDNQRSRRFVELLVRVADTFQMTTCAQGIDHARQIAELVELGVDFGQGSYYSPPVDGDKFMLLPIRDELGGGERQDFGAAQWRA